MKINMSLLPMKLHYFLFNAGASCMIPFLPVMAKAMGLSSVVVGVIYTVLPVMGMITKPILGCLADRFKIQRILCICSIVVSCSFLFAIPWSPPLPADPDLPPSTASFHCDAASDIKVTSSQLVDDKCMSVRLSKYASNITCQARCMANESMVLSICNQWNQTHFCGGLKHPATTPFHAMALKHLNLSVPESATERVFVTSPQIVQFEARIRADQLELLGDSLYLRVHEVVFPTSSTPVTPYCNSLHEMPCSLECDDPLIEDLSATTAIPDQQAVRHYQFWLLVFFIVLGWIGQAGGVSLGDAICFEMLGDSPSKYGDQRLWGSVGWGSFSIIAGATVDAYSHGNSKNYFPAVWIMLGLFALNVLVLAKMNYVQTKTSSSIMHDVGRLLAEVRVLVFVVWCLVVGMGTAIIWNFLLWYLEDLAAAYSCDMVNWIKTLEGLVMGIQCFGGELPFFFLSGRILKKLGHVHCMTLVLFAFGIRFLLYSTLVNPWLCVPIELLNGLTFGLFYATMASYASIVALPGTESTMQGLVGAIFEGVGVSLGSFLGGFLLSHVGGRKTFQIFGLGALIASALHAFVQYFLGRRFSAIQFQERGESGKRGE